MKQFDELGREIPDNTPVPHRSEVTRNANLMAQLHAYIQGELSRQAAAAGQETEDEANDFDIDEDEDTWSAYEEEDYKASLPAEQPPSLEVGPGNLVPAPEPPPPAGGGTPQAS